MYAHACAQACKCPREKVPPVLNLPLWSPAGRDPSSSPPFCSQEQVWPCQEVSGPRHGGGWPCWDVALEELLEAGMYFLVLFLTVHVLNSIIYFDSAAPLKVHSRISPGVCPHFSCFCSAVKSPLKLSSPSDSPSLQETWDLSGNRLLSSALLFPSACLSRDSMAKCVPVFPCNSCHGPCLPDGVLTLGVLRTLLLGVIPEMGNQPKGSQFQFRENQIICPFLKALCRLTWNRNDALAA